MSYLLFVAFLISLICLVLGLIKPALFSRLFKSASRLKLALIFGITTFLLFGFWGMTLDAPSQPEKEVVKNEENEEVNETKESETFETIVYELTAQAEGFGRETIEVKGETNLPDLSIIEASVDRISIWVGEDEEGFFQVGYAEGMVMDGKFIFKVTVDDRNFLEFEKISGEVIKKLDDNVEIEVIFNPAKQESDIKDVVGANGEKLENSPQKSVFGSATDNPINRLEVEMRTRLVFPYKSELPS